MAVMSSQHPISTQEHKPSSVAPTPASAGAGSMASDEAMGVDLDTHGSNKNESTSVLGPSSPKEDFDHPGAHTPFVNGNPKGMTAAPPSPPIPTPPLHGSDDTHDLSDLHITSPDGSFAPTGDSALNGAFGGSPDDTMDGSGMNPNGTDESTAKVTDETDKPVQDDDDKMMVDAPPNPTKASRDREEDEEGEDRPQKRARTEDAPELKTETTSTATCTEYRGAITPLRHKHIMGIIRSLRRSKDGRPFSMPVDHEKLGIPTYPQIVTHPMDLQTMEKRLGNNEYADVETIARDFQQIVDNCVLFNGPEHVVTAMVRSTESYWHRHMAELPAEGSVEVPNPKSKKKASSKSTTKEKAPPRPKKEPSKVTAKSPTAASPVFSLQPSGVPQIRRDSTAGDGRPKREIHPPAPKDLPYSTKPRRKQNAAELKFCDTVLKELNKKTHADYAYPFYHPVDPVALNIPDYFKIIKRPMDLSTIGEKLKLNQYENANEFEEDIRLMFNNCYKFNPENQPVHQMGRKLEEVFDEKWKDKPIYTNNHGSRSPQSASPAPHDDDDLSEEDDDDDGPADVAELEKKLEAMQEMISQMKKGKKKSPARGSNKKGSKNSHGRKASISGGGQKKPGGRRRDASYITLEQKTELSERINYLPPARMQYALRMIRDMMPELGPDDGEIELDIDELDPETLVKLYNYVSKHAPPAQTVYVPPPPPPPSHEPKVSKAVKAGPRNRKNKPMSAAEQEAKIKDLESRLHHFDNPSAFSAPTEAAAHAESDSSDDDESSGSESEEE